MCYSNDAESAQDKWKQLRERHHPSMDFVDEELQTLQAKKNSIKDLLPDIGELSR